MNCWVAAGGNQPLGGCFKEFAALRVDDSWQWASGVIMIAALCEEAIRRVPN